MSAKATAAALFLAVGLSGCMSVLAPERFGDDGPQMRPEAFFAGTTSSSGLLETRSGAPTRKLHVEGSGQTMADGTFRLEQSVTFDHDTPTTRTWMLRRLDEHHYSGTLTDASGPVRGEAYGNLFHVRCPMKSPIGGQMEQWMYLQPDGRTVMNEATVRMLGMVVAHISERITHQGGPPTETARRG